MSTLQRWPFFKFRSSQSSITSLARLVLLFVILSGAYALGTAAYANITHAASERHTAPPNTAVLTYKDDNFRTGQNANETILNTSNVKPSKFGKKMSYAVDGYVYAEPLYMPNVNINGGMHNVAFVATEHDSVYAFDADQKITLWQTSFINPSKGITTVPSGDTGCGNLVPEIGITGTPVIDSSTGTLYVVAETKENGKYFHRLHALDITSGLEKPGSPVVIKAKVKGHGDGSKNGYVSFNALKQLQRPALLLLNGAVYIAWGSNCDIDPYHGWVIGYNATTFQQVGVYNDSPNGREAGIWQSGGGLAADNNGNIYLMSGNGTFDLNTGGKDAGDTFVKLSTQSGLSLSDYFTPFNQLCLAQTDNDLGSGAPLLLPSVSEVIGAGKEGRIYVVNRDAMGKYHTIKNPCNNQGRTDVDKILQELPPGTLAGGLFSAPAYWKGPSGEFVYLVGSADNLKAFQLTNGLLSTSPTSQTPESFSYPGGNPIISSNGTTPGTGIVWTLDPNAVLRAYDATNLGKELYNSNQKQGRDGLPSYVKFSVPTVANGEVFVGTQGSLEIYGLLH